MTLKGKIAPNHIGRNNYELSIVGLPVIVFTAVSGIEETVENVDLPDRTTASGGQKPPVEFTVRMPAHHTIERAAMELWFKEGQDPVTSTYKKSGVMQGKTIEGTVGMTYGITGVWVSRRKLPDMEMSNAGELAEVEWTLRADEVTPIS